ncbi:MAG: hypothetical protein MUQ10_14205 [Anaerolineae bacterium]|nr:hypothetical protein [Anaerolineae bacterium]
MPCGSHGLSILAEARDRLSDGALTPQFTEAIKHYAIVGASLGKARRLKAREAFTGDDRYTKLVPV